MSSEYSNNAAPLGLDIFLSTRTAHHTAQDIARGSGTGLPVTREVTQEQSCAAMRNSLTACSSTAAPAIGAASAWRCAMGCKAGSAGQRSRPAWRRRHPPWPDPPRGIMWWQHHGGRYGSGGGGNPRLWRKPQRHQSAPQPSTRADIVVAHHLAPFLPIRRKGAGEGERLWRQKGG